ncbi:PAS domain-containing protein (plasmid) [Natrinema versiforme]|uniref:PAS domain-containing protein n=1 Tax=Natrinema versiforme TaxID=88724 RepID=A0A4V1G0A4_9EURY|nr:PAS domain-containing protein [Natrinema versiforme]
MRASYLEDTSQRSLTIFTGTSSRSWCLAELVPFPVLDVEHRSGTGTERLTGYDEAEIVGRICRFRQGEATDSEPVEAMRTAIDEAQPVTVELRNYRRDGSQFWNRVSIAPVQDETGAVTNYVGFQQVVRSARGLRGPCRLRWSDPCRGWRSSRVQGSRWTARC